MDQNTEKKWQEAWSINKIFQPTPDKARKKFFITVPWPYTNGSLHVGHGRTYTLGDVIARYKRLSGYNVLFPMGFHQSGTPILALASRLKNGDQKAITQLTRDISTYESEARTSEILKTMVDPKNIARYFSEATVKDFTSMGYSIDWSRRFTSADDFYQDFVRWQFLKLDSLGMIRQDRYPILFSPAEENAVGEDDISDGDIDKVSIEEFTAVKFRSENFTLLAASIRPETIFGITNLWINRSGKYVIIDIDGDPLVVSSEAFTKLSYQLDGVKFVRDIDNREILEGEFYTPIERRKVRAYEADFVDPANGTGVVYSVPGHSIIDYAEIMKQSLSIEPRIIISLDNVSNTVLNRAKTLDLSDYSKLKEVNVELYREEYYNGRMISNIPVISNETVIKAREKIRESLIGENDAFIFYETSRQAETRTGDHVIVAVLKDQWFLDYSPAWLKERAHKLIDGMLFIPDHYKSSMQETVDWLKQRPCARLRGLGTHLPMDERWIIESLSDSTIYPAVYTNSKYLRKIKEINGTIEPDLLGYIFTGEGKPEKRKYSAELMHLADSAREEMEYWYGVDVRLTSYPHLTNHLAFYILNHVAIFSGKYLPSSLIISGIITAEGRKISKSKGNGESLLAVSRKYSADIYRLYVAVGADFSSTLDWNEADVNALRKKYENFVQMLDSFSPVQNEMNSAEKWFISSFYVHLKDYMKNMEKYNIRSAFVSIFYEVMNDLRRCETRGGRTNLVLGEVMKDWLKALSPAIPHTAEEYWHRYIEDSFVSVQQLNQNPDEKIDAHVIEEDNYIQKLISDIRSIITVTGMSPKSIEISTAGRETREVTEILMSGDYSRIDKGHKHMIQDFMRNRKGISLSMIDEFSAIEANRNYIESTIGSQIAVRMVDSPVNGKIAWPGRPIIVLHD
ncbi:Leucine--tRNA ligase [Thermoplasmatales archaeon]|nr:Leucine--tRNA ligase [Thermoplasmatales archaeon]